MLLREDASALSEFSYSSYVIHPVSEVDDSPILFFKRTFMV